MPTTFTEAQLNTAMRLKHLRSLAARTKTVTDNLQAQITALDTGTIKSVKVNGTALTATGGAVDILATLEAKATPNTGYASSYQMKVNGVAVGDDINIPKDFVVKDATLETSTAQNYEEVGCSAAGKKYIDLTINTVGNDGTATHIYLPVEDLVDVYTAGNGLTLSNNEFSVVIDSTNANGLSVGANGIALAVATDSAAGAMGATEHAKLTGISANAKKVTVATEKAGTIEIDDVSKVIVEFASDTDVATMIDEELPAPSAGE